MVGIKGIFENRDSFRWNVVLDVMESHLELADLNSHVRQKTLREG